METNPGSCRLVPAVCRILCSNVRGLAANLNDLTVASSQYGILLCSETLVSDIRHVSEVLVPISVALSCCVGQDASRTWDGCIRSRWLRSISKTQI